MRPTENVKSGEREASETHTPKRSQGTEEVGRFFQPFYLSFVSAAETTLRHERQISYAAAARMLGDGGSAAVAEYNHACV